MFENFTDRAKKVMALAHQESQRLNHEYIGTEHILLGMIKEGSGVGSNILKNLDVDLRKVRRGVEKLVKKGPDKVTMEKLPQSPRAKKTIEYAIEECRALNHHYVGTEHLLLGLIREQDGVAAQVLMNLGLTLEEVRKEILALLGSEKQDIPFQEIEPLTIMIDPGQATAEDIGELFFKLSHLYRLMGGSGLEFRAMDVREGVGTHV